MIKLVISILFLHVVISNLHAQNTNSAAPDDYTSNSEKSSLIEINKQQKISIYENIRLNELIKIETDFRSYIQSLNLYSVPAENKSFNFNIISSFRKNIRFGGFWENYAIVNFTPDMFIQPFDFISLYASHNYSNYIPMTSIKENIKPLAIEGAVILAVDNTVKFLFSFNKIVQSIVNFTAKNILIGMIRNSMVYENKPLEYKYYYYSVSIRF